MDEHIRARMTDTRKMLLEHFDEDVHERLRMQLEDTKAHLDRFSRRFWALTRFMLADSAIFDDERFSFDLLAPPLVEIGRGCYHLISKNRPCRGKAKASPASPLLGYRSKAGEADEPCLAPTRTYSSEDLVGYDSTLYRLSHPLGEYVIEQAKNLATPVASVLFDVSRHPVRVHAVEALRGTSGYLTLATLTIESFEREEHLLFSAFTDDGHSLDQETCEKLFGCQGRIDGGCTEFPEEVTRRLSAESGRHAQATISRSLEANNQHFQQAREKLEQWADDMVVAAERLLKETKEQIKALQRQARQASGLEEQHEIQQKIQKLEKQQRRQRQDIFSVEDEIVAKRDELIRQLEKRLAQRSETQELFNIRWGVV